MQMRLYNTIRTYSLLAMMVAVLLVSCDDSEEADKYSVVLSAPKAAGNGQYRERVQTGDPVAVTVQVASEVPLTQLKITKTKNLEVDASFGENGVMTVPISSSSFEYDFSYIPVTEDADQLIGFTFRVEDADGGYKESDLTLVVSLAPRDNIPRKRWLWKSLLHVNNPDQPNAESIKQCEKDNSILFNADGTMVMNYGADTGSGDCVFDGFTQYISWSLAEDEKTFTIVKGNGTDVYRVNTLTAEKMELEIDIDLTVFGGGIETFIYVYTAAPR
jgi:hypothetical protein